MMIKTLFLLPPPPLVCDALSSGAVARNENFLARQKSIDVSKPLFKIQE
jgi:hypothetical protein